MLTLKDIENAETRLRGVLHATPIVSSSTFSKITGANVRLKCENMQKTGSFKVRGAYNKIALLPDDVHTVIAASAGNHAQGVAYAAASRGKKSLIVMPRAASLAKLEATRGYGANVELYGEGFDEAFARALELCGKEGAELIHAYDDEDIMAGQGTVALEIMRDAPEADTVIIPAGGGGLLAGMAIAIKEAMPHVRVIGVQAKGCDPLARSFILKTRVTSERSATIADGIAVRNPGEHTTSYINNYVDDIVTVTDEQLAETMLLLLERNKLVVEPSGAASLAAACALDLTGRQVVCVLSGGNIDVAMIHRIVERGLIARGRRVLLRASVPDKPGVLAGVASVLAACGANIIAVNYDKHAPGLRLGETVMFVTCEVSGPEHTQELLRQLDLAGHRAAVEA